MSLRKFNGAVKSEIRWSSDANLFSSCNDSVNGRLRKVVIDDAGYLNFVPLESFHSHSHLRISFNENTESLPRRKVFQSDRICFVRSLDIISCTKLKRLSWEGFWEHCTALETLCLKNLHELEDEEEEENNNSNRHGDEREIRKEVTPCSFLLFVIWNYMISQI